MFAEEEHLSSLHIPANKTHAPFWGPRGHSHARNVPYDNAAARLALAIGDLSISAVGRAEHHMRLTNTYFLADRVLRAVVVAPVLLLCNSLVAVRNARMPLPSDEPSSGRRSAQYDVLR